MYVLSLPFKLLTFMGAWMPVDWKLPWQKFAYTLYAVICLGFCFFAHITMLIHLLSATNLEEFNDRVFLVPSGASTVHKLYFILINRQTIIDLADLLLENHCLPRNNEELAIQMKYDGNIRSITIVCACLISITLMNLCALPFLPSSSSQTQLLKAWLPYSIDSKVSYWITYFHQIIGITVMGFSAAASTLMICGFLLQACAQFELLCCRFDQLPRKIEKLKSSDVAQQLIYKYEKQALKENVQHHLFILSFTKTFNEIFKPVLFQQFCMSSILVSFTVYQLSKRPEVDVENIMFFSYLTCALTEFFIYCWFCNEIMVESNNLQDSVYFINWTSLSTTTCRDLVLVILRASKPIVITCGYCIVLSLTTYIGILKMSYSVFNVLRES